MTEEEKLMKAIEDKHDEQTKAFNKEIDVIKEKATKDVEALAEKFNKNEMTKAEFESALKTANEDITKAYDEQFKALDEKMEALGKQVNKGGLGELKSNVPAFKQVINKAFEGVEDLAEKLDTIHKAGTGKIEILSTKEKDGRIVKAVDTIGTGNVSTTSGGDAINDYLSADDIQSLRLRDVFIEDFCNVTRTGKATYVYVNYVPKEGGAGAVVEGGTKPQIDLSAVVEVVRPVKAAAWSAITEEALDDVPRLQSEASNNIYKRVILKKQNDILFGDGLLGAPTGVTEVAQAFDPLTWTGAKKAEPNMYDSIVASINQVQMAENYADDMDYYPNVVFVNPADWNALQITQTNQDYIFNGVKQSVEVKTVSGVPVVAKKKIPSGKLLVGDFERCEIINYIDYNVRMGYINDQLITNEMTMVGETRYFTFVRSLDEVAFVYDDIATIITGITAV